MCKFFSCTSDGKGNILYADWELRKRMLWGDLKNKGYNPDSHTSINDYFGFKGVEEDTRNKYEYNPISKIFVIDEINSIDDSDKVKRQIKALDFKKIIPQLNIKPIVDPFKDRKYTGEITEEIIQKLEDWKIIKDSVEASVEASVWDSVRTSVGASVEASVCDSVGVSVWDSVWDSVWASVGVSVGASVRTSVRASVWASVGAYISSFFNLEKWEYIEHKPYQNPFQSAIDLWEMGIVPSYDGSVLRLHAGADAEIIYEWKEN